MKTLCTNFNCPDFWDPEGTKRKITTFPCTRHHIKYNPHNAQLLYKADPA